MKISRIVTKYGTADIKQIERGFWTYDLYHNNGLQEIAVGECYSRADADKSSRRHLRASFENAKIFSK
jgi:hypothetical protein